MTATADQAVPSPRRYITRLVPPSLRWPQAPRTYLSTVRRPALDPAAVLSPDALKLRRLNGRNPSEIASSSDDLPLPEAPAMSAPPTLNGIEW